MIRFAVLAHLGLAVAAIGASIHTALFARRSPAAARTRRLATLALALAALAFVLGALIYPAYKVQVRAGWLDAHDPSAARAFDLKEQLVALAVPVQVAVVWLLRAPETRRLAGRLAALAAGLLLAGGLLSAFTVTSHAWR